MNTSKKEDKGQQFVENTLMKGKGTERNLEKLNTTMSDFSVKNLKSLQNFSDSMQKSNSDLIKLNFSNLKAMDVLVKKIEILNHNIALSTKHTDKKQDFIRREDPNIKLYKAVDDLEDLMRENNNLQKEKKEKGGILSLIAGIGSMLGLGGIIAGAGAAIKAFSLSALMKVPLLGAIVSIPFAIKKFKQGDTVGGLIDLATGVSALIPGLGIPIAIALQGYQFFRSKKDDDYKAKEAKVLIPALTTALFLKIPILGALLSIPMAIKAFKSGDIVGGLIDLGTGAASLFPGIGTTIAVALQGYKLFRNVKGDEYKEKEGEVLKTVGIEVLKSLPLIGTFMHFKEGFDLWETDKLGAMKEFALGLTSVVPGANLIISPILGFIENFIKSKGGLTEVASNVMQSASDIIQDPVGSAVKFAKGAASSASSFIGEIPDKILDAASSASSFIGEIPDKILDKGVELTSSMYRASDDFLNESTGTEIGTDDEVGDERGQGWFTFKKWKPKLSGLKPKVWDNFQKMAKDYKEKTGRDVQINSAFRSHGGSLHGVGYAMDINSDNANELENLGLMEKYGFHRPLLGYNNETWHIEPYPGKQYGPRNSNNYPLRSSVVKRKAELDFGGDNLNLPRSYMEDKIVSTNEKIDLSESTIKAIASSVGNAFRKSLPREVSGGVNITTNMRG